MKAKHRFLRSLLLSLLVFVMLLLGSGCGLIFKRDRVITLSQKDAIATYAKEQAPLMIHHAGEVWYSMIGNYVGSDYTLSVSNQPDEINQVYTVSDVSICFFEANEHYAAWCEKTDGFLTFQLYSHARGKVTQIYQTDNSNGYQLSNVGLIGDSVYFAVIDYANEKAEILSYRDSSGSVQTVYQTEFAGEYSFSTLSAKGDTLLAVAHINGAMHLILLEAESGKKPILTDLPESVSYIYDAEYEQIGERYALYYSDSKGNEKIGVLENQGVTDVFTFNSECYAYQDQINFENGHIYWIAQVNASGNVTDHYQLVDYDYSTHKAVTYKQSFFFSIHSNGIYILSYDQSGNYKNILLSLK